MVKHLSVRDTKKKLDSVQNEQRNETEVVKLTFRGLKRLHDLAQSAEIIYGLLEEAKIKIPK